MRTALKRAAARLLPEITAEAACTEYFYEYRCVCTGCTTPVRRDRRQCRVCDGVKRCSAWTRIGTCGAASCC
jgi:hypothetical protein